MFQCANFAASKNVYANVNSGTSSGTTEENRHSEKLRKDYKGAFGEWALQMSRLQAITTVAPIGSDRKEAEERASAAEIAYRDSRDRLTDDMGWNQNISK
jgi:hypothetical protein